jgi:hypothetical protein
MSLLKVNKIEPRSGNAITVGKSDASDTTTFPGTVVATAGVTTNAGSGIGNNALTNDSITVNGVTIALGASGTIPVADTGPTITSTSVAMAPTGGSFTIVGTAFEATTQVQIVTSAGVQTSATSVAFTSSTSIAATFGTTALGSYFVRVINPDGEAFQTATQILLVTAGPEWQTAADTTVGSVNAGATWGTIVLFATGDQPMTYTEVTSNLSGVGLTLSTVNDGGVYKANLTGTATSPASTTTTNFTLRAADNDGTPQTADRQFNVTINVGLTGGTQFN